MYTIFMWFVSLAKWFRIMCSPTLLGCLLGWGIYYYKPGRLGMALGVLAALTGLVLGIKLANKVWMDENTDEFHADLAADQAEEQAEQEEGSRYKK